MTTSQARSLAERLIPQLLELRDRATVPENLAKRGAPSQAEVSDVITSSSPNARCSTRDRTLCAPLAF